MSAAYKTSKAELVAIYRLEFYKKQKSWKYCSQERKREEEKRKAARKVKLNQTYNVEPNPERETEPATAEEVLEKESPIEECVEEPKEEIEQVSGAVPSEEPGDNLNEAFVDTEPEDNASLPTALDPPNSPYSPKWSIQHWAAQCQPLWNCDPTYPDLVYPTEYPTQAYQEPNQQIPNYGTDFLYGANAAQFTNVPQFGANEVNAEKLSNWEQLGSNKGCEEGWPLHSQVWTNRQEGNWFEGIADIPEEAEEAPSADAVDGAEWALLRGADQWLSAELPDKSEKGCESLSSGSFSRGAALAPHSSEIDLQISGDEQERAAGLSAEALATAVARHADALKALLGEARRRERASPSPGDQLHSFDEYPTHDIGPVFPHNPSTVHDVIITGSFRNRPDLQGQTEVVGRGRGRRGNKSPIIGIGMGRPYRL